MEVDAQDGRSAGALPGAVDEEEPGRERGPHRRHDEVDGVPGPRALGAQRALGRPETHSVPPHQLVHGAIGVTDRFGQYPGPDRDVAVRNDFRELCLQFAVPQS